MSNESLELSSHSNNADNKKNINLRNLSSFIYNRHTHDKSMFVNVPEINFMIGIDNICIDKTSRDSLTSYLNILNQVYSINLNDIREFTKEDMKEICRYIPNTDSFFSLEYYILRHLIDYHLNNYERDLKSGTFDNIIKLSVSNDKLIVKVFPSETIAHNQVSYTISLLYLVLFQLYGLVNKHWYEEEGLKRKYINWVISSVFDCTKPIVTKVVYTLSVNADDNYTWFSQLQQLKSAYSILDISSRDDQVKFYFRPHTHYLTSTLDFPVINTAPSDTNYEARFIESTYTLQKDNILACKTTIVGKEMVDCVFATQIDEPDEPASIYSALSDDEGIYLKQYSILKRILTFTKQHQQRNAEIRIRAKEYVEQGKYNLIDEDDNTNKIKWLSNAKTKELAFDNIATITPDDKLIPVISKELQKLGQKNAHVDYIISVLELMNEQDDVINNTLNPLDKRTADKIKIVIMKLRKQKFNLGLTLNEFYKEA
jgi:hypothetical protein